MKLFDQSGKLDADVQDILYELGNVGVGMASITIGRLLGVRIELVSPNVISDRFLRSDAAFTYRKGRSGNLDAFCSSDERAGAVYSQTFFCDRSCREDDGDTMRGRTAV